MLHFITFCKLVPAVSRHSFICSRISSVWRSIGTGKISPVSGSNGGQSRDKNHAAAARGRGNRRLPFRQIGGDRFDTDGFSLHGNTSGPGLI
jgi:hypothetical protein